MLVTCMPGVDRRLLKDNLRDVHAKVENLRGGAGGGTAYSRLLQYHQWVNETVRVLSTQVSSADLDRLVLTRRYDALLSGIGSFAGTQSEPVVNGLLTLELDQRASALADAREALEQQIQRWSMLGAFVVADTNVYIEHPQKLDDLDFAPLVPVREEPIHVLVPIAVVDELDHLKRSKVPKARWRAGYTLAVLDRLFRESTGPAQLREADFSALNSGGIPRGAVTLELLFDPPGHERLPINDDEIIDRALPCSRSRHAKSHC
ncbi:MAG: PIN domain-containing protein [Actinomycetota bacterium]|nr:PIN domain-containing protein [Actinomycetota bacterium]